MLTANSLRFLVRPVACMTVLLSPKQCDVDSITDISQHLLSTTTLLPPPTSLRLPPLLSLSSPLSAAIVDPPAAKHAVIVCVLSLLRTLLRVDDCIEVWTRRMQVGRMVRERTAGERRGRGWVGRHDRDDEVDSDESDTE